MRQILWLLSLILFLSACGQQEEQNRIAPQTALFSYLHNGDTTFHWQERGSREGEGTVVYDLLLTSQKWRDLIWRHALTVIVPDDLNGDAALLYITGGKNKDGMPVKRSHDDAFIAMMGKVAAANHAPVAIVWQVPNQPLFDGLTEDQLISYTLHQFQNDSDYTWPLLFPMVKSAVRAMDAVQEFARGVLHHPVERFVVSGASKRGWTTWLTGAMDKRVAAIAPMVIDVLNMPVNVSYHKVAWGDYSVQIEDYVKLGLAQELSTPQGRTLVEMVDPYSYRHKLTMPKLIINGTNDEYWPVDAIKNYLDSIPGENYLLYVPNAGHGLKGGEEAVRSLSAFFGRTLLHQPYPRCSWNITTRGRKVTLTVNTSPAEMLGAVLWQAASADRDFRDETWTSEKVTEGAADPVEVSLDLPESGYKAFFLDIEYRAPGGGSCMKSTRMFVADTSGIL